MNILDTYKGIFIAVNSIAIHMLNHFRSINEYIVRTDDENIENLLQSDEDKVKFQKAIDELIKGEEKSQQIDINNKKITISV